MDCEIGIFGEIPCAKEQGMSDGIIGKMLSKAGKFSAPYPLPFQADASMSAFRG
jgi:hypothetical protein